MAELIADPFRAARLVLALRRQGITNDSVLSALETVDRGAFVDDSLAGLGTEDCSLPIACGQSIPRPIVTARLLRALEPSPGKEDKILLVGAGSGYTAALLGQIARHVFAVERFRALVKAANERLAALKVDNVIVRLGDGLEGLAEHGPYDRILLAGAVRTIPSALVEQLGRDGRLVAPLRLTDETLVLRAVLPDKSTSDDILPEKLSDLVKGESLAL
ncbi:MAG: protein-L-isoaspartate(D-aspartate) O-methyltransferase [Pseudomonadota bacterium]